MKIRLLTSVVASGVLVGALAVCPTAAQAQPDPSPPVAARAMPSEIPSATTPGITAGSNVTEFAEVGNKVFAAGNFSEVGGQARAGVAAFNNQTGALDQSFNPNILGQLNTVAAGPTPDTVYVAGSVRSVDGQNRSKIALLDATTGALIPSFKPPVINSLVNDVKVRNGTLYVTGYFTTVGGQPRGGVASLDATTGALTNQVVVNLTEHHNTDSSQMQKAVGGAALDVTKDGSRLIVIGNFRKANGLDRDQVVQIDIAGATSSINAWQTNDFKALCYNWANDSTVRSIALAPDDSYFVVGAGGGSNVALCDTASKWKTQNPIADAHPEWVSSAGGDTIWGVAATEHAVYIGGHQRWMNNPLGNDWAAPGAVPRSGISAVDPLSGVPLKWNPGRVPRGTAVFGMLVARDGIWLGSDTDYISVAPAYKRQKLAFFPFQGGYTATSTTTPALPVTVYAGRGGWGASTNVLYRVNAGGPLVGSADNGPDWAADDGYDSQVRNSGSNSSAWSPSATKDSSVPATVPLAVFDSERWDPADDNEMHWAFPAQAGTPLTVNLYAADRCDCTSSAGARVFDVSIDGNMVLNDLDLTGQVGHNVATKKSFDIVSDGVVNIDFTHVVENPLINAIEIVRTDTTPGPVETDSLASWGFDGTSSTAQTLSGTPIDWSTVRGAFTVGDKLYMGDASGTLKWASFDGATIGAVNDITAYHDPKWMNWPNGSGGTYDGNNPPLYSKFSTVQGMFYNQGYVYYTDGGSGLHAVGFSPDSGILSPVDKVVSSGMNFSDVGGMFVEGSTLYYAQRSSGNLYSIGWTGTTTSGTAQYVDGPSTGGRNWAARALFVGTPPANQEPTASFSWTCSGLTCSLDGSASSDPDGTIANWDWNLGDGTTGSGVTLDRTYADSSPRTVTLTVTDNRGGTSTITKTVTPVVVVADTGFVAQSGTDDAYSTVKSMAVPAAAQVGDTLLAHWVGEPAAMPPAPSGWTLVRSEAIGSALAAATFTKQAVASDLGSTLTITQPAPRRSTAQLLVYRGFSGVAASQVSTDSGMATHQAPSINVLQGDYVVSLFAERSTQTTAWTAGPGQVARGSVLGTAATRLSTFASDGDAPRSAGTDPGATATVNAPSLKGINMSLVLRP